MRNGRRWLLACLGAVSVILVAVLYAQSTARETAPAVSAQQRDGGQADDVRAGRAGGVVSARA